MLQEVTKKTTKHQLLVKKLSSLVSKLPNEERFPTEAALCRDFLVSRMTARKAVDELVRRDLLYRIQGSGTYVTPHEQKQRSIKFLLPVADFYKLHPHDQKFNQECIQYLTESAAGNNCKVELIPMSQTNKLGDISGLKTVDFLPGDPVILSNLWFAPAFEFLLERGCRCIFMENSFLSPEYQHSLKNIYHLQVDMEQAVVDAIKLLFERGRRNIAVLKFRFHDDYTMHSFYKGYIRGLQECSLPVIPEMYLATWPDEDSETKLIALYKKYKFDALLGYGQKHFTTPLQAIINTGLKIPDDFSFISCIGLHSPSDKTSFFEFPYQAMIKRSVQIALAKDFVPQKEIFHAKIIDNGSI
jgi:DNA-binding LacI/PurR family transcriptional regulator